ncbi:MAG: hypothetical protein R3F59_33015 [Myxococcota bacterium]
MDLDALYARLEHDDSPEHWLVLADALVEAGDPRGELIQLQHAARDGDAAAHGRAQAFLQANAVALVGTPLVDGLELSWRHGHVSAARLSPQLDAAARAKILAELLGHPGNRLLRHLVLDGPPGDLARNLFHDTFGALAAQGVVAPATLRSLQLGRGREENDGYWFYDFFDEMRLYDALGGLWRVFPQLSSLRIDTGASNVELGEVHAPALRELEWVVPRLSQEAVEELAQAAWPSLERLVLWTGGELLVNTREDLLYRAAIFEGELVDDDEQEWSDGTIDDPARLDALFARVDDTPTLTTLGLCNFVGSWQALAASASGHAFWGRLHTLDVSHGELGDDAVEGFARACGTARGLRTLVVDGLRIDERALDALRAALPGVALEGEPQREASLEDVERERFLYVVTQE